MTINEESNDNGMKIEIVDFDKISNAYHFVTSSHDDIVDDFDSSGSIICVNKNDFNKGLKIYKDYAEIRFLVDNNLLNFAVTHNSDFNFLLKLQERKKNIKLTEFPDGLVAYHNYIIGQKIPFYPNSSNVLNYCSKLSNKNDVLGIYIKCINILKELYENGIIYEDVHYMNFLVDDLENVHLIDFDSSYVCFNNDRKYYNLMISNLKRMIGIINGYLKIDMEDIFYMNSLDEILNVIQNEYANLKKR